MFGSLKNKVRYWGRDPVRAPDLPPEDVGFLMDMEGQILKEQRNEKAIQDCAALLLKGDRQWVAPLYGLALGLRDGLDMERAAIAEAFKALNKKETA